jgi:hypothetical protein
VFFNTAGGDPAVLMTTLAPTLAAISAGAVFMGANTYIGNAPNLMVKAIAEDRGVKMPSFFGYMALVVRHFAAAVRADDLHLVPLTGRCLRWQNPQSWWRAPSFPMCWTEARAALHGRVEHRGSGLDPGGTGPAPARQGRAPSPLAASALTLRCWPPART